MTTPGKIALAVALLLAVLLARSIYVKRSEEAKEWDRKLLLLSQQIELGDTEEEVESLLADRWPENLQNGAAIRTPLRWGAHNWVLLIDYDDRKVAALAMRSDDSYQRLPEGAPEDRVTEGFTPYWSMEY